MEYGRSPYEDRLNLVRLWYKRTSTLAIIPIMDITLLPFAMVLVRDSGYKHIYCEILNDDVSMSDVSRVILEHFTCTKYASNVDRTTVFKTVDDVSIFFDHDKMMRLESLTSDTFEVIKPDENVFIINVCEFKLHRGNPIDKEIHYVYDQRNLGTADNN